ncbi:MAG TPA: PqqD family peptide modification chaperone [Candidatus Polarisedimenticolia bacterium]|nr:PqqD family peptide modification chaperone [Candidatus Polarisedimenticolia bacterium]
MDPRIAMFLLTLAATGYALHRLTSPARTAAARVRDRDVRLDASLVFVKHPDAGTSRIAGETILSFPRQHEGLALNAVAARCWELIDGRRSLGDIAARVAGEHRVDEATALEEVSRLALRLRAGFYALEQEGWKLAHVHFDELFAGAREDGILEVRRGPAMIIHVATAAAPGRDPEADPVPAPPDRRGPAALIGRYFGRRRGALEAFARHQARERGLDAALEAFDRGWAHCAAGRLDEAETGFLDAMRLAPEWANPRYQLGYVHLRARRYPEAVEQFSAAEQLSPGYFMVREYLDLARKLEQGRVTFEAFHLFEKAAGAEPADPDLVISLCRRALELSPDFPSARLVLGRAYARKRDFEAAMSELRNAISATPDPSTLCNALYARGSIFMARGMADQAVREFEKVIELNGSPRATRSAMAHLASASSVH